MSSFIDETIVMLTSGTGGSGAVAFHREKHVPRGGPNGANGGRGGDVVLIADQGRRTLYDFHLAQRFNADNGVHAIGNKRGRDGKSIELRVPVGTMVMDAESGQLLADLTLHGTKFVVCKGGRGGHGNEHYVSSVRQVPNFAEKGEPGEAKRVKLELKMLADVGLVGLPNAGKSTLLSQISAAKPKIGAYPFTTITPNLGVVNVADESFVVADLPGLIEGASEGHGLGHQFLRHIERCKVLVHLVDAYPIDETDPFDNFKLIVTELESYAEGLSERPTIVLLNKVDLAPIGTHLEVREKIEELGFPVYAISAATSEGIKPVLFAILEALNAAESAAPTDVNLIVSAPRDDDPWNVIQVEEGFEIVGRRIERMVAMTELKNRDAVRYLHRRLSRMGVIEALKKAGAEEGDTVFVKNAVFTFADHR